MKKIALSFLCVAVLFSCQKELELREEVEETLKTAAKTGNPNDYIVALDPAKFPKQEKVSKRILSPDDPSESLEQLDGIEFFIQSKDSYFGKNTLQTYGKGQEIKLMPYSPSDQNQLFYLRFLPATSGIPYMIYSFKEQSPIGVGSYSSSPDNYVLYTQAAGSTGTFGFSWNFDINDSKDGYFFKSEDILGSGSGGPWDVYNYYLNSSNGVISFNQKNNSTSQQFNIIPNDEFVIQSVVLSLDNAEIVSTADATLRTGEVINNTSSNMTRTLQFSETKSDGLSFTETNGITTRKSGNVNLGVSLFKIVNFGGSYTFEQSAQETLQYGNNSSRTVNFTESFNITVPPNKKSTYKFKALRHNARVKYTAQLRSVNKNKLMTVTGIYSGVEYSSTSLEVNESSITSARGSTHPDKTYTLKPLKK